MKRSSMKRLVAALIALVWLTALAPAVARARVEPQSVRHDLRAILSAPEYNRSYKVEGPTILERIVRAIGKALAWLAGRLGDRLEGVGSTLSKVLACAVIVAFLALVFLIVRRVMGLMPAGGSEDEGVDAEAYQLLSARPLMKEAGRLAQAGDFRGAFRCAYLASIAHLDEAKALRFERSRTNWEYLRELKSGGHDAPYDALRPLTMDFDRKFYGGEPCTLADYERAARAYEQISSEAAA